LIHKRQKCDDRNRDKQALCVETPELLSVAKFSAAEEEDGASSGTKCFSAKGGAGVSTEQKEDRQHHEEYAHCPQAVKQAVIHCSNTCVK
jgi:hypothetical protein